MVSVFYLCFWALTLVVCDHVICDSCPWTFKATSFGCSLLLPLLMYIEVHHLQVTFVRNRHALLKMHKFVYSAIFLHVELAKYVIKRYCSQPRCACKHAILSRSDFSSFFVGDFNRNFKRLVFPSSPSSTASNQHPRLLLSLSPKPMYILDLRTVRFRQTVLLLKLLQQTPLMLRIQ